MMLNVICVSALVSVATYTWDSVSGQHVRNKYLNEGDLHRVDRYAAQVALSSHSFRHLFNCVGRMVLSLHIPENFFVYI